MLEIAVIGQSEFITCIDGVAGQIQLFRCAEADGICAIACGDPLIAVNISGEHHAVSACAEANSVAAQSKVLCHWVSFPVERIPVRIMPLGVEGGIERAVSCH